MYSDVCLLMDHLFVMVYVDCLDQLFLNEEEWCARLAALSVDVVVVL